MITVTRYAMDNGARSREDAKEMTQFAACGALAKFLAIIEGPCCALTETPTELELWGRGWQYDEFIRFQGTVEEMAGIHKMLALNLDRDALRNALVERLGTLSKLLELRISRRMPNGIGTRHLSLMLMSGNDQPDDYEHLPFLVSRVDELIAALELWMDEKAAGRTTPLVEIIRPAAQAA